MIEEQPLRPLKNLDELPVGASNNNNNFSEYPEGITNHKPRLWSKSSTGGPCWNPFRCSYEIQNP